MAKKEYVEKKEMEANTTVKIPNLSDWSQVPEELKREWFQWLYFIIGMALILGVYCFEIVYASPTLDNYTERNIGLAAIGVFLVYYVVVYWIDVTKAERKNNPFNT